MRLRSENPASKFAFTCNSYRYSTAFSSDAMLMFGVDGCVPEVVNGRVAMFGFFTVGLAL